MKKVIIAGASGMVGQLILEHCLTDTSISEVVSLVRRSSQNSHPKLKEILVLNFKEYSDIDEVFKNIDAAFFCIGVYTGQVSNDLFKEITFDYAVAFAAAISRKSPQARLCLLSGAGADRTEKSRTFFARYKGMAENAISIMGIEFYTFRPAYIYPVTPRKEPNAMYRLSRFLYPLIKLFGNNASIKSTELAKAMFVVGMNGAEQEILENRDILSILK